MAGGEQGLLTADARGVALEDGLFENDDAAFAVM
jgi:hypothetical protein